MKFWTIAPVVLTFATICTAICRYLYRWARSRPIITYELAASIPFLRKIDGIKTGVSVLHGNQEVADPHVLELKLVSKSGKDIPTDLFDQNRPLSIDVGIPIVALLKTKYEPSQAPYPEAMTNGSALEIRPSLIRKRQIMTFFLLTDGPAKSLTEKNPLIDYNLRNATSYQTRRVTNPRLKIILAWASIAYIAFYLATAPSSAAHFIYALAAALRAAGNALASFVNSI